jgi:amino acid adenylation domain-containing protein/non-ribosomal peptide synthase protein (TIGR01720 family)
MSSMPHYSRRASRPADHILVPDLASLTPILRSSLEQLMVWNNTIAPFPENICFPQLFEDQVQRIPQEPAIVFGSTILSYEQLNCRANQLAHGLRAYGVGPEVLVGVSMERSPDLVMSILAIWKAGGAYLPLDPSYPEDRLAYMLSDSQVGLVLSHSETAATLPLESATVLCLDQLEDWIAQQPTQNLGPIAHSHDLAYIIYTSGSTGRPKGTMLEFRGLSNLSQAQITVFNLDHRDRVLQFSSPSFDASVYEYVMALRVGAALHMAPREQLLPGSGLIELLRDQQITIATLPPSVLAALPAEEFPNLRQIVVAGEACPPDLVDTWAPGRKFYNAYGPTEATVWSSVELCQVGEERPPIGRPLINTQLFLLDEDLMPVPVGEDGELYIGGAGLARGYLGRPDLTADRFIPNPFAHYIPGSERLYRTGDIGRFLPDGRIEFAGRADQQVKLRGYRIELGEIEAVLSRHELVQENVVILREDVPGQKRLVAYLVANNGLPSFGEQQIYSLDIRNYLASRLPDFMIPQQFVFLERMPMTPNIKVDRRALPAPQALRPELKAPQAVARTPNELILSKIWAEVLQLEHVGIHDSFFELGGDSILSMQIIARAYKAGLQISASQFFQYPTIAELALVAIPSQQVLAEQGPVSGPIMLTPVQSWFFAQEFAEPHHWNQAMMLMAPADIQSDVLRESLQALVRHHDALRLVFERDAQGWHGQICPPEQYDLMPVVDLSDLPVEQRSVELERIAAEAQGSLDLARAPRLCAIFFDLGEELGKRLLMIINYPSIDGVSWRILLDDLQTAYHQLQHGYELSLPHKTSSYQQWGQRLNEYAQTPQLLQELSYWEQHIRAGKDLPIDKPGGENIEASTRVVKRQLSPEATSALLYDVPKPFHTQINDVLLSTLSEALWRWYRLDEVLIDLEGHGREDLFADVNISRTVGWFTSCFPVLLKRQSDQLEHTLIETKEQLRKMPQHGIGYWILRYLSPEPQARQTLEALPQAQIRFNYLGQFDQVLSGDSLFQRAAESAGPTHSPKGHRDHILVIESMIAEGCLQIEFRYSSNLHFADNIELLADHYLRVLHELIAYCLSPGVGCFSPSDFPLIQFDDSAFAELAKQIEYLDLV